MLSNTGTHIMQLKANYLIIPSDTIFKFPIMDATQNLTKSIFVVGLISDIRCLFIKTNFQLPADKAALCFN